MEYKASLDIQSKIITILISILFLGIIVFNFWAIRPDSENVDRYTVSILLTSLLAGIYLFCYLYRPLQYAVDANKIIVKRPLKDYAIDMKDIQSAVLGSKESMRWTLRTFGNGGLFGYYGKFRNATYGNMTWFATKRSNYLVLETITRKKIILTPDDTGMVNEIMRFIQKSEEYN